MPIAFSRSLRSLHADGRSRQAIWFLLLPAVVLAAWMAWFFGARITRYETTDRAHLEVSNTGQLRVVAEFSPDAPAREIHTGQRAQFRPRAGGSSMPARVTSVGRQIELAVEPGRILCAPDCPGTVEIEIEQVSPVTLLMRAAGRRSP